MMFVLFVVLDLRLNLDTGGFEYFPWFPTPLFDPRSFARARDPRLSVPRFAPVDTNLIFWSVRFLQYGQNRFVVFGTFIVFFGRSYAF